MSARPRRAAGSPVDRIADDIRAGLRERRYAPGQRLVEVELGRRLKASRSSVREALRRLCAEGIVSLERNRGASIRRLSRPEVVELYRARGALEGLAARLLAERADRAAAANRLRALQAENGRRLAAGDLPAYGRGNMLLHDVVVEGAADRTLRGLIDGLRLPILRLQFNLLLDAAQSRRSHRAHEQIVAAIVAGDGARAERAVRRHVEESLIMLLGLPDAHFAPVG